MTREEEIKQAAKNRADQYEHLVDWNNCYHHYIQGAEWADKHPRKEFWDSEKVIKWLQNNADSYTWYNEFEGESGMTDDFIEDLRKAMED